MNANPPKQICGVYLTRAGAAVGLGFGAAYWLLETFIHSFVFHDGSLLYCFRPSDFNELWMRSLISAILVVFGIYVVSARMQRQKAYEIISRQKSCLLSGILPICSYCKKIRTFDNRWHRIENFLHDKTGVEFTHGICPDCIDKTL